jgi:hypothetical protein
MFAGIYLGDTHGEGVYCSSDGGERWAPCSDGLYDLRVYRVVPSPAFARDHTLLAYERIPNGEALYRSKDVGQSWQVVLRQIRYGTPPLPRPEEMFLVKEATPEFKCDYEGVCQRSDDRGQTWTPFDTGGTQLDRLVAYALSPHYAHDRTIYFLTNAHLYRYQEGDRVWSVCALPIFGDRDDYTKFLSALATAATDTGDADPPVGHALFIGSSAGEFYRLAAEELPWSMLAPVPTPAAPTPTATPCAHGIDTRLGLDDAAARVRLGCASGPGHETYVAVQPFERGLMFWREDVRRIYVLHQDATWAEYEDTWGEGQPDRDPDLAPPEGRYQPVRGFGKVWRVRLGGAQARIGWATAPERGYGSVVQSFAHGLLLQGEEGQVYALYDDGTWEIQ